MPKQDKDINTSKEIQDKQDNKNHKWTVWNQGPKDAKETKRKFKQTTPGQVRDYKHFVNQRRFVKYEQVESVQQEDAPVNSVAGGGVDMAPNAKGTKVFMKKYRVDGRTKEYREANRRIKERQERIAQKQVQAKLDMFGVHANPFTEETENKKYLETKPGSIEDAVLGALNPNNERETLTLPKKEEEVDEALGHAGWAGLGNMPKTDPKTGKYVTGKSKIKRVPYPKDHPLHRKPKKEEVEEGFGKLKDASKNLTKMHKAMGIKKDKTTTKKTAQGGTVQTTTYKKANEEVEQIDEILPAVGALALRAAPYIARGAKALGKKMLSNPGKTAAAGTAAAMTTDAGRKAAGAVVKKVATSGLAKKVATGAAAVGGAYAAKKMLDKKKEKKKEVEEGIASTVGLGLAGGAAMAAGDMAARKLVQKYKERKATKTKKEDVEVEEAKKSGYLEPDMKKRQANNEKARKDMKKMGTPMKNPHLEQTEIDELSNTTMSSYAQKASASQSDAEKKQDYKTADKRISGKLRATRRQFSNDTNRILKGLKKESKETENGERDAGSDKYTNYTKEMTPGQGITNPDAKKADVRKKKEQAAQQQQLNVDENMKKYLKTKPMSLESAVLEALMGEKHNPDHYNKQTTTQVGSKQKIKPSYNTKTHKMVTKPGGGVSVVPKSTPGTAAESTQVKHEKGDKHDEVPEKRAGESDKDHKERTAGRVSFKQHRRSLDDVNPDELKGKHKDRDDKDIDNDGDVDGSDKFLHRRRQAIASKQSKQKKESVEEARGAPTPKNIQGPVRRYESPLDSPKAKAAREKLQKVLRGVKKKDPDHPAVQNVKEEEVNIDELSKKTLGSYVKKASVDKSNATLDLGISQGPKQTRADVTKHAGKAIKRQKGIDKAVDKLSKESVDYASIDEYQFDALIENATPEQLDEIIGALKKVGGVAKKVGGAAVGGVKKVANRFSVAGRADAADNRLAKAKKKVADRERLNKAKAGLAALKKKPVASQSSSPTQATQEEVELTPSEMFEQLVTEKHKASKGRLRSPEGKPSDMKWKYKFSPAGRETPSPRTKADSRERARSGQTIGSIGSNATGTTGTGPRKNQGTSGKSGANTDRPDWYQSSQKGSEHKTSRGVKTKGVKQTSNKIKPGVKPKGKLPEQAIEVDETHAPGHKPRQLKDPKKEKMVSTKSGTKVVNKNDPKYRNAPEHEAYQPTKTPDTIMGVKVKKIPAVKRSLKDRARAQGVVRDTSSKKTHSEDV